MAENNSVEKFIEEYDFLNYIKEDKSHYAHAKDAGWDDPYDLFLIGESGGFLLNINYGDKFVNTHLLTEAADYYRHSKTKQYTPYNIDSIPYREFRKREEYRRRYGFTAPCLQKVNGEIVNIHITGSHYNFINYTLIEQLDESSVNSNNLRAVGKKKRDISKFIDAQYWTFHIMEFAQRNAMHLIIDKTRRGGFSYIMAADSANDINLLPNKTVIHVAVDKKYLTKKGGLTDFTIANLRFYETNTPFHRGILSTDSENYILGFKLPNGIVSPKSWNSGLFSVSAQNNPDCAIGKDAVKIKTEEVSTMDNFDDYMTDTEPAMRTGAYTTGIVMSWGTATAGNMQTFERNFYSPKRFHCMPFENVWDKDSRNEICGYFKPYCWGLQGELDGVPAMDEDGNSNMEVAIRIAFNEREIKRKSCDTFSDYINYLGQYALRPAESFNSTTENIFTSPELMAWAERLRTDNSFKIYTDGLLVETEKGVEFKSNARLEAEGGKLNKDYWEWISSVPRKNHENPHGCMRVWFHPIKIYKIESNGRRSKVVPIGQYSITYDPVGLDKDKKDINTRHSHNSIEVWENPTKYNGFKTRMVAAYYGRPEKLIEADRYCYLLAVYYNCVGTTAVEINRGETVSNFSKWHALKYLMKDPITIWDTTIKGQVTSSYGINMGSEKTKLEGVRLLKEALYSEIGKNELGQTVYMFHTIYCYQHILELIKWNNIGNFDRVSSMILRGIQWKLQDIEAAKELAHRKKATEDDNNVFNREWF